MSKPFVFEPTIFLVSSFRLHILLTYVNGGGAFNWQFIRCWFINLTFVVLLTETLSHETSAGTFFYLGSLLCLNVKFNKMEHLSHPPQHPFLIQRFRIKSYIMLSMLQVALFDKRTRVSISGPHWSGQHTTEIVKLLWEYPHRNEDCIAPVLP